MIFARMMEWLRSPFTKASRLETERLIHARHMEHSHPDGEQVKPDFIDKFHLQALDLDHVRSLDHEAAQYLFHSDKPHLPDSILHQTEDVD